LSRTFKRDLELDNDIIKKEIVKLQDVEKEAKGMSIDELIKNKLLLKKLAKDIADTIRNKK